MTDTQIKCFFALARQLNYTKAARLLGISQSTLSTHITSLEKSMDLRLFVETGVPYHFPRRVRSCWKR